MVVVSAIQTWEVIPSIQRTLMKKENADAGELAKLQRREVISVESKPDSLRLDPGCHCFRKSIVNNYKRSAILDELADCLFTKSALFTTLSTVEPAHLSDHTPSRRRS